MAYEYEMRTSQYRHPDAKPGQHTNGPASLFVRRLGGPWYRVRRLFNSVQARLVIEWHGFDYFTAAHCDLAPREEST